MTRDTLTQLGVIASLGITGEDLVEHSKHRLADGGDAGGVLRLAERMGAEVVVAVHSGPVMPQGLVLRSSMRG